MHTPERAQGWQWGAGQEVGGRLEQAKAGQAGVAGLQLAKSSRVRGAPVGAAEPPLARVKVRVLELEVRGEGVLPPPAAAGTSVKRREVLLAVELVGMRPSTLMPTLYQVRLPHKLGG